MWSVNEVGFSRWAFKVSTMNVLHSSIKRNSKTYLNGKKDSDLNPSSSHTDFGDQPSHPGSTACWAVPVAQAASPRAGAAAPAPPQVPAALSWSWGLALRTHCLSWNVHCGRDGKGFSDSWSKMTWWNTRRGRTRWTGCSQALRTDVPKMNFFFLESIVYFSKYDVNQRTGGSLNHKISKIQTADEIYYTTTL